MIIKLENTTTHDIAMQLASLYEERGEVTTGRVFTLLIECSEQDLEQSLHEANIASSSHPCRIIALVPDMNASEQSTQLDAEIRYSTDVGAGDVIILHIPGRLIHHIDTLVIPLLLADTPIVSWWPGIFPDESSYDSIEKMVSARITDVERIADLRTALSDLQKKSSPRDVDLSWTRLTFWRGALVSLLDLPPHLPLQECTVTGQRQSLSTLLLASWLQETLHCPVRLKWETVPGHHISSVCFLRADGVISLSREPTKNADNILTDQARLRLPNGTDRLVSLPHRNIADCLSEEFSRMKADPVYHKALHSHFIQQVLQQGADLL